mgnify:CR=1 FL=1
MRTNYSIGFREFDNLPNTDTIKVTKMVFLSEAQMNVYRSYVTMIGEPGSKDESKLQAAQEINENLEVSQSNWLAQS